MKETAQLLREKVLKVTPQRIAVYNMLLGTTAHPNAEMIYKTLEPTNPTMSLATVYKTLDFFKQLGLVQELNVGESSSRYDAVVRCHPHTVCRICGKSLSHRITGRIHQRKASLFAVLFPDSVISFCQSGFL